ncbi:MAG: hypothetical protein ABIU96_03865 [Rhodanobacter sp.]
MTGWFLHSKFKLTLGAFVTALGLLLLGKIDSAQWVSFTTWVIGLYFAANVGDSVVTKKVADE